MCTISAFGVLAMVGVTLFCRLQLGVSVIHRSACNFGCQSETNNQVSIITTRIRASQPPITTREHVLRLRREG
jgi:hypothetical protein